MNERDKKETKQLGMSKSTARSRLIQEILFLLAQETNKDICFRCRKKIKTTEDFTIDHRKPWLDSKDPIKLYFDINNIAFSHHSCNSRYGNKIAGVLTRKKKADTCGACGTNPNLKSMGETTSYRNTGDDKLCFKCNKKLERIHMEEMSEAMGKMVDAINGKPTVQRNLVFKYFKYSNK